MNFKPYTAPALAAACALLTACSGHMPFDKKENANTQAAAQPAGSQTCQTITEKEVAALFDRWNNSLKTGDPAKVVANYAPQSILLPTVSNKPRLTAEEKADYFHHFLANKPVGEINMRFVQVGCNTVLDAGLYTFTYGTSGKKVSGRYSYTYGWDGKNWLITSHHSSAMPEK